MERLYIIIPAYNEEANIKQVIQEWYPVVERHHGDGTSRLVIINDGSRDRTADIVRSCCGQYPLLCLLEKPNSGHGATVLYGYQYAIQQGADYVFQTDSDRQTDPGEFPQFWEQKDTYAMVIGRRNKRQDGLSRKIVTKVLKWTIALCFGLSVADANTPFRLMEAKTLAENIRQIPDGFYLSNVLLSVVYAKKGQAVCSIPITFQPRQGGKNSINLPKIVKTGRQALTDFRRINREWKTEQEGKEKGRQDGA